MLWHITCHYQCFQEKTPAIPESFKTFQDRNDFKAKQKYMLKRYFSQKIEEA